MITAIHIENFKGIRERVKVDLKPITLLFGPNSSGKSSIIQAIHYAREIILHGNLDPDRTELGGEALNLGGFRNFLHRRFFDQPELERVLALRFDLDLSSSKFGLPSYPTNWVHYSFVEGEDEEGLLEVLDDVKTAWVEIRVRWSHLVNAPIISQYAVGLDGRCFAIISASDDGTKPYISYLDSGHPVVSAWARLKAEDLERFVQSLDEEELSELIEDLRAKLPEARSDVGEPTPKLGLEADSEPDLDLDPFLVRSVRLDLPHARTALPEFSELLGIGDTMPLDAALTRAIVGPGAVLREALRQFRYLGSVREVPPRHFQPGTTYREPRWATGLAAWDRLAAEEKLRAQVSTWLSREDRLATGYEITLKRFRELPLDHPLALEIVNWEDGPGYVDDPAQWFEALPVRTRLLLTREAEGEVLELQPHDVGIGLSKMIPVVVAALDGCEGIVAIEEPEANVHPRWQVGLGDLFIAQAVHDGHRFLLETHSEHVLLRLLRRIRETTEGEAPPEFTLTPDDVSVVYVENDAGHTRLHPLRIDEQGEFIDRWPHGFFAERAEELF